MVAHFLKQNFAMDLRGTLPYRPPHEIGETDEMPQNLSLGCFAIILHTQIHNLSPLGIAEANIWVEDAFDQLTQG